MQTFTKILLSHTQWLLKMTRPVYKLLKHLKSLLMLLHYCQNRRKSTEYWGNHCQRHILQNALLNSLAPSSSLLLSPPSKVWPVTVKPRGLGCSKLLAGESRLCLTATSLILVRVGACSDLPSVRIPLLSVRRFGHLDDSFFLELGRSAPSGPGEIWMEARDQGD